MPGMLFGRFWHRLPWATIDEGSIAALAHRHCEARDSID